MKNDEQLSLLNENTQTDNGPVVCLGMTFKNDNERREYFRNELRKKLPELNQIEGFPIGKEEDIIALSDPPYYTACPNPWINDFINIWGKKKGGSVINEDYHRKPFAADVSEGKSDPIYMAHGYHTKVPHKAIMRYMLHYTMPGDIILDSFSGTGMAGVAAKLCQDKKIIKNLGYEINEKGSIYDENSNYVSELGPRNVILNDLSPIATFISYNYNNSIEFNEFNKVSLDVLNQLEEEFDWMLKTNHIINGIEQKDKNGDSIFGEINYTVWSDVFICPTCASEIVFWDYAVDRDNKKVRDQFNCESCGTQVSKRNLEKKWEMVYDSSINDTLKQSKQVPVLINYTVDNKRYEKKPSQYDLNVIKKIEELKLNDITPTHLVNHIGEKWGDSWRAGYHFGISHIHQFFTKRNLHILGSFMKLASTSQHKLPLMFILTASVLNLSKLYRWRVSGKGGTTSGTLYICSTPQENNPIKQFKRKLKDVLQILNDFKNTSVITNQSATNLHQIMENSIDYIFTDPPFGANIMYSELNFLTESWIKVFTNNNLEAIVNVSQHKGLPDYQRLMEESFSEYYRALKPGRWMTVEFSNSQASVWNAIQEAIQKAGFVIANVSALDKQQGSFKAVTTTTAVKQDLVISAYKPKHENIKKMIGEQDTEESAWTFVQQHLEQLPVFLGVKGEAQIITERTPRILFDRMVAYHVQNGLPVPISSGDFQAGVAQRFPMRDGMAFLGSQVAEYDKKRTLVKDFAQMSLFVSDESSAIEWIRQQLLKKPQTRQDLHPQYMKEIQHVAKHEMLPELDDLLHQNFLLYIGESDVPDQIASYLRKNYKDLRGLESNDLSLINKAMNRWFVADPNKQGDLEKLREKSLLREFDGYIAELDNSKKKLKQFRTEAIRAGFKKAWSEKDFEQIVKVGERLPESVIQQDDKLLMYYDNAQIRLGL